MFSSKVPGKISKLVSIIKKSKEDTKENKCEDYEVTKSKPRKLIKNDLAEVVIKLEERICVDIFKNNKAMGRFAIRDNETTIAAGTVTKLIK